MMVFTEEVGTATLVESFAAAEHTLPSDGCIAVLLACFLTCTKGFKLTRPAQQVFLGSVLLHVQLSFAVYEASKVWF